MALQFLPFALAALGTFQAVNTYNARQDQAEAIKRQAELDRQAAAEQLKRDSLAETDKVLSKRDKLRRMRSVMEAQYAKSGVLLDGSVGDILTKQREIDEKNVQNIHRRGNDQRRLDNWRANEQYRQSIYQSKSLKDASRIGLFSDLATTGIGFGMSGGFDKIGGISMSNTPSQTMAGQTWNMNYFKSVT